MTRLAPFPPRLSAAALARMLAAALLAVAALAPTARAQPRSCPPTRPDALGPFYQPNAPERATTGRGFVVSGVVRSTGGCLALPGARIEWWSANPGGEYDGEHRAVQVTDDHGGFRYETDFPGRYPGRPPHLHVRVSAAGHQTLVTQIYPRPGGTALEVELVLRRR